MPRATCPLALVGVLGSLLLGSLSGCDGGGDGRWAAFNPGPVPDEFERGERLYNSYCLSCHGRHGKGDGLGPPMLDSIYLAAVVPDERYFTAVRQGMNQRFYNYGAMPPLERVSDAEVAAIIPYVRWVQQRAWARTAGGS